VSGVRMVPLLSEVALLRPLPAFSNCTSVSTTPGAVTVARVGGP
jgi:hypothetical protein